jgi:hypothetical protein
MQKSNRRQLPNCLQELMNASSFDDDTHVGENEASKNYHAYADASELIPSLVTEDLGYVLDHGTPAGRLYVAILLKQSKRVGNNLSFGKLVGDQSMVTFKSGLKKTTVTVASIARSFIEDNRYMNFTSG